MSQASSAAITVEPGKIIERILTLELVRVTERAAVASARLRGKGNEKAADQAAVDAMRRELNRLQIDGTVVIGEGERDEAQSVTIITYETTEEAVRGALQRIEAEGEIYGRPQMIRIETV